MWGGSKNGTRPFNVSTGTSLLSCSFVSALHVLFYFLP